MKPDNRLEELFGLRGKVVMVTGAAGQLGSALVTALVQCEAKVAASDASLKDLQNSAERWGWIKGQVDLNKCDIRDRKQIILTLESASKRFGCVEHLVNNAGVSVFEPYLQRPESSVDLVMDVNLKGTILCTQEFIKNRLKRGGGGSIVNIASHYGLISPDPRIYTDCDRKNSEIYGATKAGIIQMTRYYAVHAAEHGIRVNAVSPGGIRNPDNPQGVDFQKHYAFRCPMRHMAETHEIVGAVLFLLSPAASYVNGHNLVVDGGMSAW